MSLNPAGAEQALGKLFENPPGSESDAINGYTLDGEQIDGWGDAIETLCSAIVPSSSTVSTAVAALKTDLEGLGAASDPDADPGEPPPATATLEAALVSFATTVGNGMAPAYTATPPVSPVGISFSNMSDAQDAADAVIDTIDTWLRTGTATPSSGGSPVNWS